MTRPPRSLPDTNIIVRYLIADDTALFEKANDFFEKVKHGTAKAVILESVIAESIYVLTKIYGVPSHRAAGSLTDLLRYKGVVNNDREELIRALSLFSEHGLDIVYCILCAKASAPGDHLLTFDGDLRKLVGKQK